MQVDKKQRKEKGTQERATISLFGFEWGKRKFSNAVAGFCSPDRIQDIRNL